METAELIPMHVLTGFLGSGKTTLLKRLLRSPQFADTAVLINEFGEVALDHLLVERIDDATVVLDNGCICCTVRSDLSAALRELYAKLERGRSRPFGRVVMETTGLADPAPILFTLMADPVIRHHFRIGNVVTTVDAAIGTRQFADNPESVKQAAVADRLVLTKTDIATPESAARLRTNLARLNPSAEVFDAGSGALSPEHLLGGDPFDPAHKTAEVREWLDRESSPSDPGHAHADLGRHAAEISSFSRFFDAPLDWTAFGVWLTMLLNRHGERILRVKGLLAVVGADTPVVVNGVQHLVHPPFHLERWPTPDRRSRIVFIARGLDPEVITRSLLVFNRLAGVPTMAEMG